MRIAFKGFLFALFALSVTAALAGPPKAPSTPRPVHRAACARFVEQYCKNVPWGQGRRIDCLAKHKAQLDGPCRDRLALMQQLFAIGKEQRKKTDAALAKEAAKEAEKAKKAKSAPAAKN